MLFPNTFTSGIGYFFIILLAYFSALAVAVSFHEFAHAYVAMKQGDHTAKVYGRCTLAPHAHFDTKGFIFLMLFRFGWAKPVPVDSRNFKNGKKSAFLVAIAGVVTNLIIGILFLFIYMLLLKVWPAVFEIPVYGYMLEYFLLLSVQLNFALVFMNLLPIYPLDGYKVIESFCKTENSFLRFTKDYSLLCFIILSISSLYYFYYTYTAGALFIGLIWLFGKILGL